MHVCVLGGNGFIGSHVLDELRHLGHEVLVYDRQDEKYRPPRTDVEYVRGELCDFELLRECLSGVDCVIHLASSTLSAASNQDPILDIQSNLVTTLKLLQVCVDQDVKTVVFVSSGGTVYGIPQRLPIVEDHPNNPISSYGIVKLAIEKYLALYARLYGIGYQILRPSNPYGERQNPLRNQGIVAVSLWRVLHNQPVVVFGDGSTIRDYLYVGDLSRAICLALGHTGPSRIFNVGSGQGQSINELIDRISKLLGVSVRIKRHPARLSDVPRVVLDTGRIQSEMNWQPQVSMEEGLRRTWDWLVELKRRQ